MKKTVMICAGGTGGHMFPALSLAEDLKSRDCRVVVVTDKRAEKYTAGREGMDVHVIASATLPPSIIGKIKGILSLARGYFQSRSLISDYQPGLVIGFGGYPSMPPMVAAQRQNITTIIHEQNAVLGKANAYLAPKAERIALSLPDMSSLDEIDAIRAIVTGNPVRADIASLYAHPYNTPDDNEPFHITIMGGSLGAKVMAKNVPQALSSLPEDLKVRLNVTQQCHAENIAEVQDIYTNAGITATLAPFFDNVPDILKSTHLMIARSGASTVAEIAIAGIPAIYIPYPHHADQQQKVNAQSISNVGGAWVMDENDLTPETLANQIESLMRAPQDLFKAAESARSCAKPEATRKLGNLVIALLKGWN
jgi:UDP-N-acetylglucosamine--N-acetylmuramyl-(pentapeptide) pyrophosphoryl-undecaprenol N-acetylglucosamine transferase